MTQEQTKKLQDKKKQRLAKALRENLLRRKAWQRAQAAKKQEKK